jgi:NAD(P)-dependent dehydrogenase (short-subunit alcohol dehydrogenase family)
MKKQLGAIVFSSESGVQIPAEMVHYGMTKAAQIAIGRGLPRRAGTAITVNSVLAGPTASEGVTEFVASLAKSRDIGGRIERGIFSQRPPEFVAETISPGRGGAVVAFVCSPAASAINGTHFGPMGV